MANNESIQNIMNLVRTFDDARSKSLPEVTKKTRINSAMFIQKEISESPIIGDISSVMLNLYLGYILSALELNTYITETTTVRDYLETVATESYIDDTNVGSDFASAFGKVAAMEVVGDADHNNDYNIGDRNGVAPVEFKTQTTYPNGRIVNVTLRSPHDKNVSFTVPLFITLSPRIIEDQVADQFISLNMDRDWYKRWLQFRAGEKRFFRDFIAQMDLLEKRRKALKQDKTGDLSAMLSATKSAVTSQWLKLLRIKPNKQNIANSILMFDKHTFEKACNDAGYNFRKYTDRQKFFNKSYAMAVVVIDQNYNLVETYFNCIEHIGEYTFNQLMATSKKDTLNLMAAMSQMSQNKPVTF